MGFVWPGVSVLGDCLPPPGHAASLHASLPLVPPTTGALLSPLGTRLSNCPRPWHLCSRPSPPGDASLPRAPLVPTGSSVEDRLSR